LGIDVGPCIVARVNPSIKKNYLASLMRRVRRIVHP
jgi:hypothetical protein